LLDTEEVAIIDDLTGIYNKRYFMQYSSVLIEKARRDKENCYLLYFDIDFFKKINDTYGHDTGDKVLIEIASRIKSRIRGSDLFARIGGEEFIIFMNNTDDTGISKVAERLRLSICGKKFECGNGLSLEVSSSVGVSKIIDFSVDRAIHNTMEKAISNADSALYTAKKDGRNRVSYYEIKEKAAPLSQAGENITTAEQVNDSAAAFAESSKRFAAAMKETSLTMDATASMVKQNAENARVAAQLSSDITELTKKGAPPEEITAKIDQLNKLIAEISMANEEQANGANMINIALSQMEKVASSNATVAQELAANAEILKEIV
jgi:diguanylate cyclase (GGDEF)-like protein